MPCGSRLAEAVAAIIAEGPLCVADIFAKLNPPASQRAIRYALAGLMKDGRAVRDGKVYGVGHDQVSG